MRGVFLDLDTVSHHGDLELAALHQVLGEMHTYGASAGEQVVERVGNAEIVLTNKVKLSAQILEKLVRARLVCVAATGTDNVDLNAARRRGIGVCNVPAYSTQSVVQQVFAFILALTQHLREYETLLQQGAWRRAPQYTLLDYPTRELQGRQLGILGYGHIGKAVARVAEAFGMRLLLGAHSADDNRQGRLQLSELLKQVDVLTIHLPKVPETTNLIGARELAHMKPDALLINCARGGIVDEQALAQALRNGKLGGAGIDVLSEEPPVHGNPLLAPGIPNLIVTPHVAWAAREARQRVIEEMALNIEAFSKGQRRNRVD
ncbi:MAG: glycerate dehydrogenase [Gammaproteobacteria bacterium]|nr:glycerate dehydrogenase [Gammaproteobacteria bacterium]